jgi:tetratricopeptide (TPR) repeat protein
MAGPQVVDALARACEAEAAKEHGLPLMIEADRGELADLPWESLTLPGQSTPLALHPTIRPYRAFAEGSAPLPAVDRTGRPLRMLVLLAGPRNAPGRREALLDLDAETARLAAAVSKIQGTAELRVLSSGSLTALRSALVEQPADIVHIVCHARPGELLLEDDFGDREPVNAVALCRVLQGPYGIPTVVLAGCSTASSVRRLRPHAGPEPAYHGTFLPGLAQSLIQYGAPAVVAMSAPVRDVYAGALMADMYAGLAAGRPLWEALHSARTEQERVRRSSDDRWLPEWHVPVLFAGLGLAGAEPGRGGPLEKPVAPAAPAVPFALPLGSFVGRRTQLRAALNALAQDGAGLVVHGVGGVGKTAFVGELLRLRASPIAPAIVKGPVGPDAILREVAAALAGEADDELTRALSDAGRPWSERLGVLAGLTVPDTHVSVGTDVRHAAHSTARSLTLVLDDFEANLTRDTRGQTRFTDPALADFLSVWTTSLTHARLLIASRHPLPSTDGAAFERLSQMSLPPLSRDETDLLRLRLPLTRLLPRRAWQEIRQAVGGHPRTYAYLEALLGTGRPTDDLAWRIGRLNDGLDAARARIRRQLRPALREALSLTAADTLLDDLLATLDPGCRILLHRVAVHRVPVPASAFADPDRADGTHACLDALVTAGLLAEDGRDTAGIPLWSVHRWTAAELDRRDPQAACDAHRRAAAYEQERFSRDDLPDTVRIDAGFEALHHLGSARRHSEAAALGRRLCGLLHARGRWITEKELCHRMLEWSEPDTESEAVVHRQLGLIERDQGEMRAARDHLERALAISTAAGDALGVAYAEHQLGSVDQEQGDHRAAGARYLRAHTAFRELGRERDAAASLYQMSLLDQYDGRPERARAGFGEAMEVFARLSDLAAVISCHRSLAYLAEDEGDLDTAMTHCRSAVALCEETGDRVQAEALRNQIGTLHILNGDYDAAHSEFDAALRSAVARDGREEMARSHQHLGICAERMGALEIAEEHIRTALSLNGELERVVGQAQCLTRLAGIARLRGRPADGLSFARRALVLLGGTDETRDRPDTYHVIGDCLRDLGRIAAARRFHTAGLLDARSPVDLDRARTALRELDALEQCHAPG